MDRVQIALPVRGFGETSRRDNWWVQPVAVVLGISTALAYMTWAAFQGEHYTIGGYLSPLYSPEIFGDSPHSLFGPQPGWWPLWLPFSPALLILPMPAGFRVTCYYYRGAYYKAFWADPPSCAVGEPRDSFLGENSFPLIIQNVHRYFLYIALGFILFLSYDVWNALWFEDVAGNVSFGFGVGTLVLALNVVLLGGYTFSCHSLCHLVGGRHDCVSEKPAQQLAYDGVNCLNKRHMLFTWLSLGWVAFADLYVRMCAMGGMSLSLLKFEAAAPCWSCYTAGGKTWGRSPQKGATMKKSGTVIRRDQSDSPAARHLPLVDILVDAQAELQALVVASGLKVLEAMLEEDRVAVCGPR